MAKMGLDKARLRMWKLWQEHSLAHSSEVGHLCTALVLCVLQHCFQRDTVIREGA